MRRRKLSLFHIKPSCRRKCDFSECNPGESFNQVTRVICPFTSSLPLSHIVSRW